MSNGVKHLYEFGQFRLDVEERVLFNTDSPVSLAPKVFEILLTLVEKSGQVVSKNELMETVWADSFVEEANLTQSIFILRKTLGDGRRGRRFIENVPRRGYRFVCPVKTISDFQQANDKLAISNLQTQTQPGVSGNIGTFSPKWKNFFAPIGVFAVFLIVVGLVTSNFYQGKNQNPETPKSASTLPDISIRRLTSDSRAFHPAISPEGKHLAYMRLVDNKESVWLKNIASGGEIQILPPSEDGYSGLAFSPDGSDLFFNAKRNSADNVKRNVILRVPIFGGLEREAAKHPWSRFALSPDGKQIAFIRSLNKPETDRILVVAETDGDNERILAKSEPGKTWFSIWSAAPSWSPDGKKIVVSGRKRDAESEYTVLFEVRVSDGAISEIPAPRWNLAAQTIWLPDGTGLLVVVREKSSSPLQIWHLAYPSGAAQRITNDLNNYLSISLTADSNMLVAQQEIRNAHIWVLPETDSKRVRQLTFGTNANDGTFGLAWIPDGRIIFSSNRDGEFDLWTVNQDGGELRQITFGKGANQFPRVSPDGRYIVFVSNRAGKSNLWRMEMDGSNPVQLTKGEGELWHTISPDSRWVFYTNIAVTPNTIEKISIDGGEPLKVPNETFGGSAPTISPDGKFLAYYLYAETMGWRTGILPVEGGKTLKFLELQGSRGREEWTPDSQSLIYIKPGFEFSNLWRESLDGKLQEQITHFNEGHIWNLSFSPDGKHVALSRGNTFSDIVLIENFR